MYSIVKRRILLSTRELGGAETSSGVKFNGVNKNNWFGEMSKINFLIYLICNVFSC